MAGESYKYIAKALLPFLLLFQASGFATVVEVANLRDLVEQAERIFVGECQTESVGQIGQVPYTAYTFRVITAIKGVIEETVTVRQLGVSQALPLSGGMAVAPIIAGMPHYGPNETVLLFVTKESPIGLSSPAGLGQGAFFVHEVAEQPVLVNSINNQNLTHELSKAWLLTQGLTEDEIDRITEAAEKGPVDYDLFLKILPKLIVRP